MDRQTDGQDFSFIYIDFIKKFTWGDWGKLFIICRDIYLCVIIACSWCMYVTSLLRSTKTAAFQPCCLLVPMQTTHCTNHLLVWQTSWYCAISKNQAPYSSTWTKILHIPHWHLRSKETTGLYITYSPEILQYRPVLMAKVDIASVGWYDTKSIDTTDTIQFIVSIDTPCQKD